MAKKEEIKKKAGNAKRDKRPTTVERKPSGLRRYMRETMGELRKVSWPTRQEAINLTKIVLIVMVIMGAFLGTLDWIFLEMFKFILQ